MNQANVVSIDYRNPQRGSQHAEMRRRNERSVLSIVRRFEGLSGADIARQSGLTPQTVSVVLQTLERRGIVGRGQSISVGRGHPVTPIHLKAEGSYGIGVEIAWHHIEVVLLDLRGRMLARERWPIEFPRAETLIYQIIALVERILEVIPPRLLSRVAGLGVAMPTGMHTIFGTMGISREQEEAFEKLNIVRELDAQLPFSVFGMSDGTAACQAEFAYGRGSKFGDAIHIFISTFVEAGIFVDGRVVEKSSRDAASIGSFMLQDRKGNIQPLHMITSIKALEDRLVLAGKKANLDDPTQWDWNEIEPEVNAWINESGDGLALAIANFCTVVEFSAAIVDGTVPGRILERIVQRVSVTMSKLPITTFDPPVMVRGTIGAGAPAIGAANFPMHLSLFSRKHLD